MLAPVGTHFLRMQSRHRVKEVGILGTKGVYALRRGQVDGWQEYLIDTCFTSLLYNRLTVFISDGRLAADVERLLVKTLHFNATVMEVRALDAIPLNANDKVDYPRLEKMAQ